ncbi:hypothetical protein Cst_c00910 [Thermoclostridium stercorarium subsp. stercorarium DSM 8532]|uniref:SLH domain-containing protein n=1 Tax=Thermoclostridium stercorarium (strain ATCC 35414 / DSM 8532 / NCIMB 11754) TaxID=1121335 RepID=L7VK94_THES1|nr:transglutaminase domain-containing protein [Thermoclostridium stercorarium]AGC67122.1 hypothetical protein Cst_c00910 [Thermoclostridium stercorarium subsp. stercorarium DSM 8532]
MSVLRSGIKIALSVLFSLVFFLIFNINIAGTAEVLTRDRLDCLYPAHLRYDLFYDGRLTDENIVYLKSIPHSEALRSLNVLRGDSKGNLMLDRFAERIEGATMLVRLLGVEAYAVSGKPSHPFTDVPEWAAPYIGYLYQNGFAKGIGNNQFGSRQYMDEKSYLAFLLRVLGYSEEDGDFSWDTVGKTAIKVGLLESGEETYIDRFIKRERMSQLTWRAMFLNHKFYGKPLLVCLYEQGKVRRDNLSMLFAKNKNRLIDLWYANLSKLEEAFLRHDEKIELSLSHTQVENDYLKYLEYTLERVQLSTGVYTRGFFTKLWQQGNNYSLVVYPRYQNTASRDEKLRLMIDRIVSEIMSPYMTDYEKVKAAHDYVINMIEYDSRYRNNSALDALESGYGVCSAYSELMALILNSAGVPCRIVRGYADVSHAWNMVSIDGKLYHVDATWDDLGTYGGEQLIRYDYLNLPDAEMEKEHRWEKNDYPACTSTEHNYFVKNNLLAKNSEDVIAIIAQAVENRQNSVTLKYAGNDADKLMIHKIINDVNSRLALELGYRISHYVYTRNDTYLTYCIFSIDYEPVGYVD